MIHSNNKTSNNNITCLSRIFGTKTFSSEEFEYYSFRLSSDSSRDSYELGQPECGWPPGKQSKSWSCHQEREWNKTYIYIYSWNIPKTDIICWIMIWFNKLIILLFVFTMYLSFSSWMHKRERVEKGKAVFRREKKERCHNLFWSTFGRL